MVLKNAKSLAEKISAHNGRLYLVGGAVRDLLMNKSPKDYDYCITGLNSNEFKQLVPEAIIRGKAFPVFDFDGSEFALARKEVKVSKGHKGFDMISNKDISIEEDLIRRDITINSIALDVISEEIIDPYKGQKDIKNKVIRATSKAFMEDPLRVYRTARFASELVGFEVEKDTLNLMNSMSIELYTLPAERIFVELEKALKSEKPSLFFETLRMANVINVHFKEVADLIGIVQPVKYHPEGDAYNHTMIVIDKIAKSRGTIEPYIIFAGLVHDFGKATTPKDILPRHIGHEERGVELTKKLCRRLKLPTKYEKAGVTACREHMKAGIFYNMRIATKVDFLERLSKSVLGLDGIELIANADNTKNTDNTKEDEIKFAALGKEMLEKINAKAYPKDIDYNIIKEKLRRERIKFLKEGAATK